MKRIIFKNILCAPLVLGIGACLTSVGQTNNVCQKVKADTITVKKDFTTTAMANLGAESSYHFMNGGGTVHGGFCTTEWADPFTLPSDNTGNVVFKVESTSNIGDLDVNFTVYMNHHSDGTLAWSNYQLFGGSSLNSMTELKTESVQSDSSSEFALKSLTVNSVTTSTYYLKFQINYNPEISTSPNLQNEKLPFAFIPLKLGYIEWSFDGTTPGPVPPVPPGPTPTGSYSVNYDDKDANVTLTGNKSSISSGEVFTVTASVPEDNHIGLIRINGVNQEIDETGTATSQTFQVGPATQDLYVTTKSYSLGNEFGGEQTNYNYNFANKKRYDLTWANEVYDFDNLRTVSEGNNIGLGLSTKHGTTGNLDANVVYKFNAPESNYFETFTVNGNARLFTAAPLEADDTYLLLEKSFDGITWTNLEKYHSENVYDGNIITEFSYTSDVLLDNPKTLFIRATIHGSFGYDGTWVLLKDINITANVGLVPPTSTVKDVSYYQNSNLDLVLPIDYKNKTLTKVTIGNQVIDLNKCEIGANLLTIKYTAMKDIVPGEYNITATTTGGSIDWALTVNAAKPVNAFNGNTVIAIVVIVAGVAVIGACVVGILAKKRLVVKKK